MLPSGNWLGLPTVPINEKKSKESILIEEETKLTEDWKDDDSVCSIDDLNLIELDDNTNEIEHLEPIQSIKSSSSTSKDQPMETKLATHICVLQLRGLNER
jgi:hypothetical protein